MGPSKYREENGPNQNPLDKDGRGKASKEDQGNLANLHLLESPNGEIRTPQARGKPAAASP